MKEADALPTLTRPSLQFLRTAILLAALAPLSVLPVSTFGSLSQRLSLTLIQHVCRTLIAKGQTSLYINLNQILAPKVVWLLLYNPMKTGFFMYFAVPDHTNTNFISVSLALMFYILKE